MTRLLLLLIVGALGCTTESSRTDLLDQAHQASQQIDQGTTASFPSDVTALITSADQLRTDAGDPETTTEFLGSGLDASKRVDAGDKVFFTTPILQLLDAATQLTE